MNKIEFGQYKTDIGSYNLGVSNDIACVVFIRTDKDKRFSLKEVLKKHTLEKNGKLEITSQFCFYKVQTTEQMWLPKNKLHERWMRLWGQPLTKEISTETSKMVQGKQQELEGHTFEYAVTKLYVPIR
jgi:hypothetical protein